jgi:hypothetical protein
LEKTSLRSGKMSNDWKCPDNIGVPKISFLWQEIYKRKRALKLDLNIYYTYEDGTLVDDPNVKTKYKWTPNDIKEQIKEIKRYLSDINEPVNNNFNGSHCCPLGLIILKC